MKNGLLPNIIVLLGLTRASVSGVNALKLTYTGTETFTPDVDGGLTYTGSPEHFDAALEAHVLESMARSVQNQPNHIHASLYRIILGHQHHAPQEQEQKQRQLHPVQPQAHPQDELADEEVEPSTSKIQSRLNFNPDVEAALRLEEILARSQPQAYADLPADLKHPDFYKPREMPSLTAVIDNKKIMGTLVDDGEGGKTSVWDLIAHEQRKALGPKEVLPTLDDLSDKYGQYKTPTAKALTLDHQSLADRAKTLGEQYLRAIGADHIQFGSKEPHAPGDQKVKEEDFRKHMPVLGEKELLAKKDSLQKTNKPRKTVSPQRLEQSKSGYLRRHGGGVAEPEAVADSHGHEQREQQQEAFVEASASPVRLGSSASAGGKRERRQGSGTGNLIKILKQNPDWTPTQTPAAPEPSEVVSPTPRKTGTERRPTSGGLRAARQSQAVRRARALAAIKPADIISVRALADSKLEALPALVSLPPRAESDTDVDAESSIGGHTSSSDDRSTDGEQSGAEDEEQDQEMEAGAEEHGEHIDAWTEVTPEKGGKPYYWNQRTNETRYLPDGWAQVTAENDGRIYYWKEESDEVSWTFPGSS